MSNFVLYSILNAPNTSHKFRVRVDGAYKCTYGGVTRRVKYSNFGLARTKNIGLVAENGKFYQVETDFTGGKIKITTTAVPMDGLKELAKRLAYDRVRATQLVALRQAAKKKKK